MKYLLIAPLVLSACGTVTPVCEPDHYPYSCERSREENTRPDREPVREQDEAKHDAWEHRQKGGA